MWNTPSPERLSKIPKLYETEEFPCKDKQIYLHFFIGGCDWFIAEYSKDQDIFFGFACLNGDWECADWGFVSFEELKSLNIRGMQIDCELEEYWKIRPFHEVIKQYAPAHMLERFDF